MLFNSLQFAVFFPVVTLLYFILPPKFQKLLLLTVSCIFYMAFVPKYIFVIGALIIIDYTAGLLIKNAKGKKRKIYLLLSILANVSLLGFFKYFNFLEVNIETLAAFLHWNYSPHLLSIILPLGLSFHTFQSMSYTIEVFKRKQKAEKNIFSYALYVLFFPQLVAGPIERPQHLLPQLKKTHNFNYAYAVEGLQLMLWGFFQKLVIADRLSLFVSPVFNNPQGYNGVSLITATIFFSFQIYCDFAGYTNITRGAAKVLGIDLVINFNKPYFAISVQDFWRRWHISLSSWFRDYVYIPLGGNRKGTSRTYINILMVFAITGLWHGANWTFVIWGLMHGAIICLEQTFKKIGVRLPQKAATLLTFTAVTFSWIFFRSANLNDALYVTGALFNLKGQKISDLYLNKGWPEFFLAIFLMLALMTLEFEWPKLKNLLNSQNPALRWTIYYLAICLVLLFGVFSQNRFIYFQF